MRRGWAALMLAALLAGCALTAEQKAAMDASSMIKLDPTLLTVEPVAPATRLPMRLALFVPPSVPGAWSMLPYLPGTWMTGEKVAREPVPRRMQTEAIVATALREVLQAAVPGEVNTLSSMPGQAENVDATLELVSVQFDYDERRLTWFPVPIPFGLGFAVGQFEASTRLSMQLRLVDAQGYLAWTRNYDDGSRLGVWDYPASSGWREGIQLAVHQGALRVARQALQDLRDWQATRRIKPRTL